MKITIFNIYEIEKRKIPIGKFRIIDLDNLLEENEFLKVEHFKQMLKENENEFFFIYFGNSRLSFSDSNLIEFYEFAKTENAGIVYSNYFIKNGKDTFEYKTIDYTIGSLRDDFDFGKLLLIKHDLLQEYVEESPDYKYSEFYNFVLFASRESKILRLARPLYSIEKTSERKTGEIIFDYVRKKNIDIQKERERAVTKHLEIIGAKINQVGRTIKFEKSKFKNDASVIIPVKNRDKTITEAVKSALSQKTNFEFNIIVVDNHSTDNTTKQLVELSKKHENLIHIIPESTDLQIGGCWNLAIENKNCGLFSVQLDSDDVYADENSLQKIIDKFYEEQSACVIGSYKTTDWNLNEIPPGVVNHHEWTNTNGMNNGLRIQGFGAPRAFYTPLIREIKFPNVSYGEDYSVMLKITREYKIGRIYEPIYFVRRWEGNSDANLSNEKMNDYNIYKDELRTNEILERQKLNAK